MKVSPLTKTIVGVTAAGAAYVWVQRPRDVALRDALYSATPAAN